MSADPFVTARSGGSPRTVTPVAGTSTGATTAAEKASERPTCSSAPATRLSSDQLMATRYLLGDEQSTGETDSKASSAPCSVTRGRTSRRSLSDKLTRSLITSGLVCGITPSSIRALSGQPIRVLAFSGRAGGAAGEPAETSSSGKGTRQ